MQYMARSLWSDSTCRINRLPGLLPFGLLLVISVFIFYSFPHFFNFYDSVPASERTLNSLSCCVLSHCPFSRRHTGSLEMSETSIP